jgi:hypothetical protein
LGKIETISSKVRNETRVSTLSTLIQYIFGILSQSNNTRKRNKRNINREGKSQIIPADDMILCLKDPKNPTKNS